jgi:type II secretory ATPase GspE/PulE/Tfp pilus assembly ATPase PilB-like protein
MRVEPFLISASLLLVIAQRLVRVLCPNCKEAYDPPAAVREKLEKAASFYTGPRTYFNPKGCEACHQTGFRGRKGIYEIFQMTTRLRELVVDPKTSLEEIRTVIREDGMRNLYEEGACAVLTGDTSVEEMMRVCTLEE